MESAVHIENLTINYGQTPAVSDISFDIYKGDFLAIMGPNGGGKSTLLKAILGLIPINSGELLIFDKPVSEYGSLISYVPQFSEIDRKFPISVLEVVMTANIRKGVHPFFKYSEKNKNNALEQLEYVGIRHLYDRQISELSGGEFQRLLIARAIAVNSQLLILDEPTASVDPSSRKRIYDLLKDLNTKNNMTIIMVTHDLSAISSMVKKIACLNQKLVYHGEPQLTQHIVNQLYGCPVDLIAHGVPHRVLKEHGEDE